MLRDVRLVGCFPQPVILSTAKDLRITAPSKALSFRTGAEPEEPALGEVEENRASPVWRGRPRPRSSGDTHEGGPFKPCFGLSGVLGAALPNFQGPRENSALYQGTTFSRAVNAQKHLGFQPLLSAPQATTVLSDKRFSRPGGPAR